MVLDDAARWRMFCVSGSDRTGGESLILGVSMRESAEHHQNSARSLSNGEEFACIHTHTTFKEERRGFPFTPSTSSTTALHLSLRLRRANGRRYASMDRSRTAAKVVAGPF